MNETSEHNPDASPKWLCVVCDPESYDTIFCTDIMEGWKQANYFTPDDANPEEVECFRRFMEDEDNWWRDPWGKLAKLRWNVGGESCGTVTFYRIDEDRSQSAHIAELERRVEELTEGIESARRDANEWFGKWEVNQTEKINLKLECATAWRERDQAKREWREDFETRTHLLAERDEANGKLSQLRAEVERLKERAAYADFLQKAMERIAGLFGVETPLQLIARAKDNEQNYVDILCELISEHLATLQRERDEDRALLDEVQKRKLTITWNPRHDGFIIQEQEQVCGNIAHNSDLRAAIRAARAQPED